MTKNGRAASKRARRAQLLLSEAVGVLISSETVNEAIQTIRDHTAIFLNRESVNLAHWIVEIRGIKVHVRYNHAINMFDRVFSDSNAPSVDIG